ncbi:MAG: hypothetical protein FWD61_19435 [Phycisphaerales bacterium]|nr:hypothetical protein [Phycisphaerales bacterium]
MPDHDPAGRILSYATPERRKNAILPFLLGTVFGIILVFTLLFSLAMLRQVGRTTMYVKMATPAGTPALNPSPTVSTSPTVWDEESMNRVELSGQPSPAATTATSPSVPTTAPSE